MSTIKVGTLLAADGSTTTQPSIPALDQRMASAWVNFNGTGTIAIRDSYNVSSLTDISTGNTFVNFATTMANANYTATIGDSNSGSTWTNSGRVAAFTTSSLRTITTNTGAYYDELVVCVIVMGG